MDRNMSGFKEMFSQKEQELVITMWNKKYKDNLNTGHFQFLNFKTVIETLLEFGPDKDFFPILIKLYKLQKWEDLYGHLKTKEMEV